MHILHITPYYAPAWAFGGVVSAVSGLAAAQAARGHRVTVLTTDALDFTARHPVRREMLDGVAVSRCPNLSHTLRARYNLSTPRGFRAAFRQIDADVLHVHELRTVENLLILPVAARMPVVLSPHGTLTYAAGRSLVKRVWDRLIGGRLLRRIHHVAALTAAEADEARALWAARGVPFPGASIIPNGVAADFADSIKDSVNLRARYGLGTGPVVLFLGRLHERKGLQFLIPAFAEATHDLPEARLLLVGPDAGMRPAAEKLAAQQGIAERVIFTGMLTGEERLSALAAADVFALPAIGEGLSMAALEAMAARLPLIVTPGCNLPEVETRGAGLLVERAVVPLAAAIRALVTDPARRRAMGECGAAWVREVFTWPAIAAQTEALYTRLIPPV